MNQYPLVSPKPGALKMLSGRSAFAPVTLIDKFCLCDLQRSLGRNALLASKVHPKPSTMYQKAANKVAFVPFSRKEESETEQRFRGPIVAATEKKSEIFVPVSIHSKILYQIFSFGNTNKLSNSQAKFYYRRLQWAR